jgi:NAD(P)-dependent dehydrogenase (short-subunit alcohol dehydrogenase family)
MCTLIDDAEGEAMMSVSYGLEEKVVVVTGGSRGIGLSLARSFLAQGAKVVICGRKQQNLDAAVEKLEGGERLLAVPAHVAKEGDVEALFDAAVGRFGGVDCLVNNVGMNLATQSVVDADLAVWNKIIEGNLTGAFLCSRKAARIMREKKRGKIVNISSLAGTKAMPGMGIYGIAKAGLDMLTQVLGAELAPCNIQVNAIAPGLVRTDFSKIFWSAPALCTEICKTIPAGRIAETVDLVPIVLLLSSGLADYITGQTIMVDGGASAT